jgi:hypothetical protein
MRWLDIRVGSIRVGSTCAGSIRVGSIRVGSTCAGSIRVASIRVASIRVGSTCAGSIRAGSTCAGSNADVNVWTFVLVGAVLGLLRGGVSIFSFALVLVLLWALVLACDPLYPLHRGSGRAHHWRQAT